MEGNSWERLLHGAVREQDHVGGTILFLGSRGTGKRSLTAQVVREALRSRLSRRLGLSPDSPEVDTAVADTLAERTLTVVDLGYTFLDATADSVEAENKIGIWALEDDARAPLLLKSVFPDVEALSGALVVICIDLTKPWNALEELNRWTSCIRPYIDDLLQDKPQERQKLINARAKYEHAVRMSGGDAEKLQALFVRVEKDEEAQFASESGDFLLPVPLVVVGTKSDVITDALDDLDTELRLEFIQKHLREFCLENHASLTYTSSKLAKNIEKLLHYLMHRLRPQDLLLEKVEPHDEGDNGAGRAICTERDSIHIPLGLDHNQLIEALANTKNQKIVSWSGDAAFEDVICPPKKQERSGSEERNAGKDETEGDEAMQNAEFLAKLLAKQKLLPETKRTATSDAAASALKAFNETATSMKPGIADPATMSASVEASSEDASKEEKQSKSSSSRRVTAQDAKENPELIANFFNDLLNRDKK